MATPTGVIGRTSRLTPGANSFTIDPTLNVIDVSSGVPSQAIQTGDIMFAILTYGASSGYATMTPSAGWINVVPLATAGTLGVAIYMKQREASDTTYSWTQGSGATPSLRLAWVRGAKMDNYIVGTFRARSVSGGGSSTTNIAADVTTTAADMTAYVFSFDRTTATETEASITVSNFTKVATWATETDGGSTETACIGYKPMAVAGATGTSTITYPNTQASNGYSGIIALNSADDVGTPETGVIQTAFIPNFTSNSLTVGASVGQGSTFKIRVSTDPAFGTYTDFTGSISSVVHRSILHQFLLVGRSQR